MPISNILILPDGCLENQEFVFQCKDPEDARFYSVSLDKRMQETDVIDKVEAFPNDEAVIIDDITNNKRDFKCRISGGKLNTKIGIRFKVTTQAGEIHSFVCTLSIMQQGKLTQEGGSNVILGTTGPKGEKSDTGPQGPVFGNDGTADLNVHSFKSDGGNFYSNGSDSIIIGGTVVAVAGIISNRNILVKPPDKNSNSSVVLYNSTGENEQSITLVALKTGTFILPSKNFADLPTSENLTGTQYFCTDAYSTLNPQKTKGIIVVWNGSKWVDALGSDIATI